MKWFLKDGRRVAIALAGAALFVCLVGLFLTRGSMADLSFLSRASSDLVDQRPWQTVQALAPLAVSAEEQDLAQQAERLADHEVERAFAQALREAGTQSRPMTGNALALSLKVGQLQQQVKSDQAKVDSLGGTKTLFQLAVSQPMLQADPEPGPENDDLDAAKTQLQLDSDELAEASEDLAHATGDKRGAIQQELAARELAMKKTSVEGNAKTAVVSARSHGTLWARVSAWIDQRSRRELLLQAKREADSDAAALEGQHVEIEAKSNAAAKAASASLQSSPAAPTTQTMQEAAAQGSAPPMSRSARLQALRTLSEEHAILEDRLTTQQQLSKVYDKWAAQVDRQHKIVFHLMLRSFALIACILLGAVLVMAVIDVLVDRSAIEPRRVHTMKTIAELAVEVLSLLLVLLVIFGPPSQVPTILGLATAGVTVVFQDFILAFFGWFVLMGKNGIRVGDWVEINAVGGEVVEISLFRTTLMETGNWTDKGHPTGRRVTFINNFAITGQYFNFSTVGQWMWDEITLNIPSGEAAYKTIEAIRERVVAETEKDTRLAAEEWKRSARQQGLSQFTPEPSLNLRPGASGIDIVVRYITRAGERFETRNNIYQAMTDILHLQPDSLSSETKSAVAPD